MDEKTLSAQSLQVQTLKPDAECVLLLPGDEGVLTGDAAPDAGLFDPGVGEADAVDVGLPFAGASLAINADDDGSVAIDGDVEAFIEEVIGLICGFGDVANVFGLVHYSAVEIDVGESVGDDRGDGSGIVMGFGLVPSALELADLDLVATCGGGIGGRLVLGEERTRRGDYAEQGCGKNFPMRCHFHVSDPSWCREWVRAENGN